jgi:hypothetical protein
MPTVKTTSDGIGYLSIVLKDGVKVITKAVFWRIPHHTSGKDICLKIGRYNKPSDSLESEKPKSELTLDNEEFNNLLDFISNNYTPLKDGAKTYITIDDPKLVPKLKAIFGYNDKTKVLDLIINNDLVPDDIVNGIKLQEKKKAILEYEEKLKQDHNEGVWQTWFKNNSWVLGSEFVRILDDRKIDTENISDYLMEAYDGFLDIIEIKRPGGGLQFWSPQKDHDNIVPHSDLVKAITQTANYIYEVEREMNSDKFLTRIGRIPVVKPRAVLIYGRSNDWDDEKRKSYRILNSSYHNITILTYDHVLERAKRIIGTNQEVSDTDDIPF